MSEPASEQSPHDRQVNVLISEIEIAIEQGRPLDLDVFLKPHPECAADVLKYFEDAGLVHKAIQQCQPQPEETEPVRGSTQGSHPRGTTIRYFGDYEILEELGSGGMGVVYKARQKKLKRLVALKMIKRGQFASQEDVKRFQGEAQAAANLDHPGIVRVIEVGVHQLEHYYAMDYVTGGSLSALYREQPVAARHAAKLVKELAEAMHYAHGQGVVHRDLKPANVLLTKGGSPRITDFGLAMRLRSDGDSTGVTMTQTGQVLGTAGYMSPEQASGKTGVVNIPTDIYSLGAILYALLTSRAPFVGDSPSVTILQVINNEPIPPRALNPSVHRDLETICLKCLEKEPYKRYGTAQLLGDDLLRFLENKPVLARPVSGPERAWRWCKRNSIVSFLIALIAFSLISGAAVSSYYAVKANHRALAEEFQRKRAEEQTIRTQEANDEADKERQAAENSLYFARIHLTRHYWDNGLVTQTRDLLDLATRHSQGLDLRNWEWYWLRTACSQQQHTATGHDGAVFTVAGEPEGQLVASGGQDGTVRLWNSLTGQPVHVFRGHQQAVRAVAWHPQGRYVCSGGDDGTVRIWDAQLERKVLECSLSSETVLTVGWSPDGKLFLAGGSGKQVRIWNFEERTTVPERALDKVPYPIRSLAWNKSGDVLLAGHGGGRVGSAVDLAAWDTNTWKKKRVNDYDLILNYPIRSISLNPGQDQLAVSAEHSRIRILKTSDFQEVESFADTAEVQCVAWNDSAKGPRLAFSGNSQVICIYDPRSNRIVGRLWGHQGTVHSLAWLANDRIVSAGDDGALCFWDASDFDEATSRRRMSNYISSLSWSPDCRWLAIAKLESDAVLWDTEKGHADITLKGHTSRIWSIAWHPSGSWVATKSMDKSVRVWDAVTGQQVWIADKPLGTEQSLAWSPDGSRLAVDAGLEIIVWEFDAATGKGGKVLTTHPIAKFWGLNKIAWHPNSQLLATPLLKDGHVYLDIWNVATGETSHSFDTGTAECRTIAWSPDGDRIAWGDARGKLAMWAITGTEPEFKLHAHDDEVAEIRWSPDGQRLATAGWEGTVKIRSSQTGEVMLVFRHDQGRMQALAWSSDGKKLAGGNWSDRHNYVRIWDATLGYTLAADDEPVGEFNAPTSSTEH